MSDSERGEHASFDRRTGEVHGSGVDAGGSGPGREDYDQDPMGGSGEKAPHGPRSVETAADRPIDPDEGT